MNFSVALQVYSVRDFAEKDLEGTLQKIKEMGYDGVELAGLYGYSYAEVKAAVEKAGLALVSAHVALADMLADPQGVLSGYAEMGWRVSPRKRVWLCCTTTMILSLPNWTANTHWICFTG